MRLANFAFAATIAFALVSGSATAGEQRTTSKSAPQPTVMSDEELDQVVGGALETWARVIIRINDAEQNGNPHVQAMLTILIAKAP